MNLDDMTLFKKLDMQNMLAHINGLPQQLSDAWDLGCSLNLPEMARPKNILIAGMGGSAIGADLLAAYAAPYCQIPVTVHRDYDLPAWAHNDETLVIASSHSGNTEETLGAYQQARARGCRVLVISTGGKLAQMARADGVPFWIFEHSGQPRAAVGFSFGLLLAAFFRLGLIPDPTEELRETLRAMREQQSILRPEVQAVNNPAKRMAGQLMGRWVAIFAADYLDPVARRWKGQISEIAKAWAQFEFLPEADHNSLAGLNNPESALMQTIALFLQAPGNHPRNQIRLDFTRQVFMTQGINTDMIQAKGESPMAHIWTLLHFGDYTAFYLAMAYGEDPTPVEILAALKEEMGRTS